MASHNERIDNLRVASPCPAKWEQMSGDDRVRLCDLCNLHVYNIAQMTRKETQALVASTEGRLCARLFRRSDGTIITKDCPVGLRAIRRRVAKCVGAVFATLVSLAATVAGQKPSAKDKSSCRQQITITRKASDRENGTVTGTVSDPLSGVVAGARVTMTDQSTKKASVTESNSEGHFQITGLSPGTYALTIDSAVFKKLEVADLVLGKKESLDLALTLTPPEALTGVVIVLEPSLLDRNSTIKTTFSGDLIQRLPH